MQEKLEKDVPTLNNKFKELAIGKILVLLNNSKLCPFLLLKVPNNALSESTLERKAQKYILLF